MTVANDSILVTPGTGATVATHLVGSKEHQVVMLADAAGQLIDDPVNVYVASTLAAAKSAGRVYLSINNADASLVVDVLGVWAAQEATAAVTGLVRGYRLGRHNSGHTAGTSNGWQRLDTTTAALDADITVRSVGVSCSVVGENLAAVGIGEEETGAGGAQRHWLWNWKIEGVPVVLRQNEGLALYQDGTAGTGLLSAGIIFRVRS